MSSITARRSRKASRRKSAPIPRSSPPTSQRTKTMLEIQDLQVSYGSNSALQGISLKVEAGSIVTLVGANGAGKTTTLRTISGIVKAKSGTITFNGEEIANH